MTVGKSTISTANTTAHSAGFAGYGIALDLMAGLVCGALVVFFEISLAALIFSGQLSDYFSAGIGIMLLGTLATTVIATVLSKFRISVCIPQDAPATILALLAAGLAGSTVVAGTYAGFATVVLIMGSTTILTGVLMWCFGHYNLGRFVRFLPYPVIGGFMAGTGWLLFMGGLSVVNDGAVNAELLTRDGLLQCVPALLFALSLLISTRRYKNPLIMPALFVVTAIIFIFGISIQNGGVAAGMQQAMQNGWLLGPLPEAELWRPVTMQVITHADWQQLAFSGVTILTVFLISIVSLLLNISGLEIITKTDVNLNRELKSVGLANIASGTMGCSPGYHMLSISTLNHRLGAQSKLAACVVVLIVLATLVFGAGILAYTPRVIVAGFLLFLGLSFLIEWLYDGWYKLPKTDYALVCMILLIIATAGLLQGIITGMLIAVVLFAIAYTNTDVIRHTFTRNKYQSYIMRAPEIEKMLEQHGDGIYVVELQGFIFFGMAHQLLDKVKARIGNGPSPDINHLLLDMRLVTGIDSSASYSFSRLKQISSEAGITLSYSNTTDTLQAMLTSIGAGDPEHYYDDLDHAIATLDEQIIRSVGHPANVQPDTTTLTYFQNTLQLSDDELVVANHLQRYMQFREEKPGAVLLEEGAQVDRLFFIETGKVHIQTQLPDGTTKLLRVQNGGTVFGEIGMYTHSSATASVVVAENAQIYSLSQADLQRMEIEDPAFAIAVHRLIASVLGRKLTQANFALIALQK